MKLIVAIFLLLIMWATIPESHSAGAPKAGHTINDGNLVFKLEETGIRVNKIGNGDRVVSFMVMSREAVNPTAVIVSGIVANCNSPRFFQVSDAVFVDGITQSMGPATDLIMDAPKLLDRTSITWTYTDMICDGKVKPSVAATHRKSKPKSPGTAQQQACPGAVTAAKSTNPIEAILATVKDLRSDLAGCESDLSSVIGAGRVTRP